MFWVLSSLTVLLVFFSIFLENHMMTLILIMLFCLSNSSLFFMSTKNCWMSLMIIIIFISGIMVLFMYIVSLTEKEKFTTPKMSSFLILLPISIIPFILSKISNPISPFIPLSSLKPNLSLVIFSWMTISITSLIPPLFILKHFKGMKSSK